MNLALRKGYGYELFDFAMSLATVLSENPLLSLEHNIWTLKREGIPSLKKLRDEIICLKEVKKRIDKVVEELDEHLNNVHYWESVKTQVQQGFLPLYFSLGRKRKVLNRKKVTITRYNVGRVLLIINREIGYYKKLISGLSPVGQRAGRYTLPMTIIASFWSCKMKYRKQVDWKNVWILVNWFYRRLEGAEYREELIGRPSHESIYRFKLNFGKELKKDLKIFFSYNYRSRSWKKGVKPRDWGLRFAAREPKLYRIDSLDNDTPLIIFSDGSKLLYQNTLA